MTILQSKITKELGSTHIKVTFKQFGFQVSLVWTTTDLQTLNSSGSFGTGNCILPNKKKGECFGIRQSQAFNARLCQRPTEMWAVDKELRRRRWQKKGFLSV